MKMHSVSEKMPGLKVISLKKKRKTQTETASNQMVSDKPLVSENLSKPQTKCFSIPQLRVLVAYIG